MAENPYAAAAGNKLKQLMLSLDPNAVGNPEEQVPAAPQPTVYDWRNQAMPAIQDYTKAAYKRAEIKFNPVEGVNSNDPNRPVSTPNSTDSRPVSGSSPEGSAGAKQPDSLGVDQVFSTLNQDTKGYQKVLDYNNMMAGAKNQTPHTRQLHALSAEAAPKLVQRIGALKNYSEAEKKNLLKAAFRNNGVGNGSVIGTAVTSSAGGPNGRPIVNDKWQIAISDAVKEGNSDVLVRVAMEKLGVKE
jgi:hypothetical protein